MKKLTSEAALSAIRPDKIHKTPVQTLVTIHGVFKSIADAALYELNERLLDEEGRPIKPKR